MDGVDVVISEIEKLSLSVIGSITVPYKQKVKAMLDRVVLNNEPLPIHDFAVMDVEIGKIFAEAVNDALRKFGIRRNQIIAVGSHGQTLRHSPFRYTIQPTDRRWSDNRCLDKHYLYFEFSELGRRKRRPGRPSCSSFS